MNDLLPNIRYFAYLEISRYVDRSKLFSYYSKINEKFPNFSSQKVRDESEIWPVFQKLFSKNKKDA